MSSSKISLLSQMLSVLDRNSFARIVKQKQTDKHNKGINSWTHFVAMLFMQLSGASSVRDISNGLRSATGNLNHMGVVKGSMQVINKLY